MTREEQQDLLEQAIHLIEDEDNIEQGVACLLRAAEAGMPEAMQYYAQYLQYEKKDIPAAVDWYEKCYRTGYELDLRAEYSSGTNEFRAAIDARFTPAEKKAMRIRPQAYYDTLVRLLVLLMAGMVGGRIGQVFRFPYASIAGSLIGVAVALCFWKRISYSRMQEMSREN